MDENFIHGFLFAVVIISGLLALQYGDNFNFLNSEGFTVLPSFGTALNWKTAICLSIFFELFFRNLNGSLQRRIFNAFWLLCLGWVFMDFFWILKAYICGNYLFGSADLSFINATNLMIGISRNVLMAAFSLIFIRKSLKLTKGFFAALFFAAAYWIFILLSFPYSGYCFSTFIVYPVSFLPVIVAFKNWSGKSWRKFLFA